jgi:hypothetical protein
VHEIGPREDRLTAMANEYVKDPCATLVVSPENQSRQDLNDVIHRAMQREGHVDHEDHHVSVLVPRQEMTGIDSQWAERYEEGDVVRYCRGSKALGIEAGDYKRVERIDAKTNHVTVRTDDERTVSYDPRRLQGVTLYRETERAFATGDRVQSTAPDRARDLANRELGTVERIDPNGQMEIRWDSGRMSSFESGERRHLDYGDAVTSLQQPGSDRGSRPGARRDRPCGREAREPTIRLRGGVARTVRCPHLHRRQDEARTRSRSRHAASICAEKTPGQVSRQSESREISRSESISHSMAVASR